MQSHPELRTLVALLVLALIGAVAAAPVPAGATSSRADGSHPIRPGSAVTLAGITCTAGPVLHQKRTVYLAIPASCGGISPGTYQDGCTEADAPLGIPVKVAGARHRARLVYDSFTRMQSIGTAAGHDTASRRLCHYNDLALVQLSPRDVSRVTAAGASKNAPTGIRTQAPADGHKVTLGPDPGTAGRSHQGGWEYDVTTTASLSATDIGLVAMVSGKVLGMLTVVPGGALPALPVTTPATPPAQVYSFAKALRFLKKAPGFHHVSLLKAGEHS